MNVGPTIGPHRAHDSIYTMLSVMVGGDDSLGHITGYRAWTSLTYSAIHHDNFKCIVPSWSRWNPSQPSTIYSWVRCHYSIIKSQRSIYIIGQWYTVGQWFLWAINKARANSACNTVFHEDGTWMPDAACFISNRIGASNSFPWSWDPFPVARVLTGMLKITMVPL